MASLVTQFGPKRLGPRTPISNFVQPKFSPGLYGSMMGAVQVEDLMLERWFNGGDSLFNPWVSSRDCAGSPQRSANFPWQTPKWEILPIVIPLQ